ncbi:uncharacterized protein [Procambarus clarkii]|uniref:uncharacterized protein n=1 Tax=Procambarus clarkii TaxID=6728 RepID=UPI001E6723DD|nr:proline-rich protein 2-like [Procambarus clarkii]
MASAGEDRLEGEKTTEGDEGVNAGTESGEEAGERAHSTQPRQPREADNRWQGRQAPPQQQHPRTAWKQPAADAPPQPPNGEHPRQEPLGPQSTPVGQTYQGQTKQSQREHPPKPSQEPHQAPGQSEQAPRKPHSHPSRGSHSPKKPWELQHEERHIRPPYGPQHHTGNRSGTGPDKRPEARAHDTNAWTE